MLWDSGLSVHDYAARMGAIAPSSCSVARNRCRVHPLAAGHDLLVCSARSSVAAVCRGWQPLGRGHRDRSVQPAQRCRKGGRMWGHGLQAAPTTQECLGTMCRCAQPPTASLVQGWMCMSMRARAASSHEYQLSLRKVQDFTVCAVCCHALSCLRCRSHSWDCQRRVCWASAL